MINHPDSKSDNSRPDPYSPLHLHYMYSNNCIDTPASSEALIVDMRVPGKIPTLGSEGLKPRALASVTANGKGIGSCIGRENQAFRNVQRAFVVKAAAAGFYVKKAACNGRIVNATAFCVLYLVKTAAAATIA